MKKFENLGRLLSKGEQKSILGGTQDPGGTCTGLEPDGANIHNLSLAEARDGGYVHWCCDSCSSASWYCPGSEYC